LRNDASKKSQEAQNISGEFSPIPTYRLCTEQEVSQVTQDEIVISYKQ